MIAPSPILIWATLALAVVTVSPTLIGEPLAAGRSLPAASATRTSPATNWNTPAVLASAWLAHALRRHAERANKPGNRLALSMGPSRPSVTILPKEYVVRPAYSGRGCQILLQNMCHIAARPPGYRKS